MYVFCPQEEPRPAKPPVTASPQLDPLNSVALPLDHEDSKKWFYRDPQGDLQGKILALLYLKYLKLWDILENFKCDVPKKATSRSSQTKFLLYYLCNVCIELFFSQTGPFTSAEMAEWFSAGYFTMNLLVKRGCDERFQALGKFCSVEHQFIFKLN